MASKLVSFKDFTAVQYAGGNTEEQDRYAKKRHVGTVGEDKEASTEKKEEVKKKVEEKKK